MTVELRMTLAAETPADVAKAIEVWRSINKEPNKWASLEATEYRTTVRWGHIWNGVKQQYIQEIKFTLEKDGTVYIHYATTT